MVQKVSQGKVGKTQLQLGKRLLSLILPSLPDAIKRNRLFTPKMCPPQTAAFQVITVETLADFSAS